MAPVQALSVVIGCFFFGALYFSTGTSKSGNSGAVYLGTGAATVGCAGAIIVSVGSGTSSVGGGEVLVNAGHSTLNISGAVHILWGEGTATNSGVVVIRSLRQRCREGNVFIGTGTAPTCRAGTPSLCRSGVV